MHCHLQALIFGCSRLVGRGTDKAVYDARQHPLSERCRSRETLVRDLRIASIASWLATMMPSRDCRGTGSQFHLAVQGLASGIACKRIIQEKVPTDKRCALIGPGGARSRYPLSYPWVRLRRFNA